VRSRRATVVYWACRNRGWTWCWRRGDEKEVGVSAEADEGRDFFLGGGLLVAGANCGAAIGMGSESGMGMGLVLVAPSPPLPLQQSHHSSLSSTPASRSCCMIVYGLNTSYLFRLRSRVARVAWLYVCLNTSYLKIVVGSRSCCMVVYGFSTSYLYRSRSTVARVA
jgi:hypothetical protein